MTTTPQRQPGRPRSGALHQAILDAALALLGEVGFHRLSIEGIAARAGVGKTTIYRRWASREEIVVEALAQLEPRFHLPDTGDLWRDVNTLIAESFDDQPAGHHLLGLLTDGDRPEFRALYWEHFAVPRRRLIVERLDRARTRGELRGDVDLEILVDLVSGAGLYRLLLQPPAEPFGDYLRRAADVVLRGAAPR